MKVALMEVMAGKIELIPLTEEEINEGAQDFQEEMAAERSIIGDSKPKLDDQIL